MLNGIGALPEPPSLPIEFAWMMPAASSISDTERCM